MPQRYSTTVQLPVGCQKTSLDQRIAELRAKKPVYVNHGEALLLQGVANASLREQRIIDGKFDLD